jgi:6-phosphogluconate dehydrogenase
MGANMVRRLVRGGHQCVVFDMNKDNVAQLVKDGATGTDSLDGFLKALSAPRAV